MRCLALEVASTASAQSQLLLQVYLLHSMRWQPLKGSAPSAWMLNI